MYFFIISIIILSGFIENAQSLWSSDSIVSKYTWTADKGDCISDQSSADVAEGISVVAYSTESVILWCNLCDAQDNANVIWSYGKKQHEKSTTLRYTKHMILYSNGNLQIYDVRSEHQGVYVCHAGDVQGRRNILEVLHEKDYPLTPVKPKEAKRGDKPAEAIDTEDISIYTKWTPWSLCSTCEKDNVGIRYSIGTCYVKNINSSIVVNQMVFHDGIWCHSNLLPSQYKNMEQVKNRKNEVMTGLCTMTCKTDGKIQTSGGREIDAHPNMANKHGMLSEMPASFHLPDMKVIHIKEGEHITIECNGHLLSDVTKRWTKDGDGNVIREEIYTKEKRRVRVTARQKLVIEDARVADSGSYSCWKLDELVTYVKLKVYEGHILETHVETILSFIVCGVVGAALLFCHMKVYFLYRTLKKDNRLCDQ